MSFNETVSMSCSMKSGLLVRTFHKGETGETTRDTRARTRRNANRTYMHTGDTAKLDAFYGDNEKDL
jgi:hypothetical protein